MGTGLGPPQDLEETVAIVGISIVPGRERAEAVASNERPLKVRQRAPQS